MKIAIVGNNSSISKALITCINSGEEIITLGRKDADIEIDLNSKNNITLPDGIDAIIHTAAHFGGTTLKDICDAINVNIVGTIKLLDAAIISNVKQFIYISSIYSHLQSDSKFYNIYSISKKCSENVLKLYSTNKAIKLVILRPSLIYGNFQSNRKHHPFFYSLVDKIRKNEKVIFYGRRDPKRNFIYIDDLANIIYKTVQHKIEGEYDCAYPKDTSFIEIAKAAKVAFNSNSEIVFDHSFEDIPDINIKFETSLYEKIHFKPEISIYSGMNIIAEYLGR
jgi:nucleoside-diphosphate-sugar epimerase